jgi:acyl-CoA synthetase (NDP forming)
MMTEKLVEAVRRDGRTVLTEVESKNFIREAGIPVVETRLATSKRQASAYAQELGFPVALKIVSPEILHKSDVGGVRIGLKNQKEVNLAYGEIVSAAKKANPSAQIHGISVQPMAASGVEVIIGMTKDAYFGPVLMFGLGGVMVEVLKDVAFRIVPLTPRDARQMLREIKGYPILEGYRGQDPVDLTKIEESLLNLSTFLESHTEVRELDLNPVFVYGDGLLAVDARVILEEN